MPKQKTFKKTDRFEVRCRPTLRQLADKIQSIQNDRTFAATFRGLVIARATTLIGSFALRGRVEPAVTERRELGKLLETVIAEEEESS